MKKILFLFSILTFCFACGDESITLKSAIFKNETGVVVDNKDKFSYKNMTIQINGQYKYNYSNLAEGERIEVGYFEFADSDGNIFNPFLKKVLNVSISCKVYEGYGGDDYKFGFAYGEFN